MCSCKALLSQSWKHIWQSGKAHNNVRLAAAHGYLENHFYKEQKWQSQWRESESEADLKHFVPDEHTDWTVIRESSPQKMNRADAVHQTTSMNIKSGLLCVWSLSFVQTSPITHQPFAHLIISMAPVIVVTSGLYGGGWRCQHSLRSCLTKPSQQRKKGG